MSRVNYFIDDAINRSSNLSLNDFIAELNDNSYPDIDTTFMKTFLELSKEENDGRFIVHHKKLIDCGVLHATSDERTKKAMLDFGLEEDEDFVVVDAKESSQKKSSKNYMMTPVAYKFALLRAPKSVDSKKYIKYFHFLENAIRSYNLYQMKLKQISRDKTLKEKILIEDVLSQLVSKVDNVIDLNHHIKEDERDAKFSIMSITATTNAKLDAISSDMIKKSDLSFINPSNPKLAMALVIWLVNAGILITYYVSPDLLKLKLFSP